MTRLAMEAHFQYVPIAPEIVPLIASLVAPAPATARFVDICAGEGDAAAHLAAAWGIGRDRLYLNELADARMARCTRFTDHVLGADAIRTLQISRNAFQIAWTNPPFGQQPKEQGGGRLEPLFFKRIVEEGGWLQPGGVHLMLAPQDVWLTNLSTLNHLARCYDHVTMLALPAEHRRYREALVIGVVRAGWRSGAELKERARLLAERLADALPELTPQAAPRYTIPSPLKQPQSAVNSSKVQFVWRDANAATPEQAQADVLTSGGAWASRSYQSRLQTARRDRRRIRPIFPLGKVAAALRVAEGDINNMIVAIAGRRARIKGGTRRTTKTWQEERVANDGATVIDTHRMELREPVVVTLDTETAAITRYSGDAGIAALMDLPDAAQSLLDAVAQSAPPVYDMQAPPEVASILERIVPASGRALPGYPAGFIPMQRHVIAAIVAAFRQPDPHTGKRRTVMGLSAEMGSGKAQPLSARVLTPCGWKRMGEMQVGDAVIGADGKTHTVIGVYPQGEKEIYRVTFSDGSAVECCADHLWRLQSANHRKRRQNGVVLPLRDFMHNLQSPQRNNRWYVPMAQPVEFPPRDLPIDPYVLGLLIGDGTLCTGSVGFTTVDGELLQAITCAANSYGLTPVVNKPISYRITSGRRGRRNPLLAQIRALGLTGCRSEVKFIPPAYRFAPVTDRIALLQGLLDTDGSVDRKGCIEFSTSSERLARDVRELVESLGGTARVRSRIPHFTHNGERRAGRRNYRLQIALPSHIAPFRLMRKAARYTHRPKYPPSRAVVKVEYVGRAPAQCIRVDAPDQLYITDHYVVTHNSSMSTGAAEVIRQLLPTNRGRAFTVLVVAPNHLIGELSQVRAYEEALAGADRPSLPQTQGAALPQWIAEWRDLLPHWHSTILETPAQVAAFYAGASADPTTPRVGFIAFSRFSLGSGWEVAVTSRRPAPPVPAAHPDMHDTPDQRRFAWRAQFYQRLLEEERREWDELRKGEAGATQARGVSTARRAQRVAQASSDTGAPPVLGPGVSERTIRRDRLFRCGTAHRAARNGSEYTPLWHFDGVFCPDCGRRARNKDGLPHTRESLRRAGMVACPFCGGRLGQLDRKQDNVGDRELPIFNDPSYLNGYVTEIVDGKPQRVIPWGKRPTSNPRIALGDFIVARGYADRTDLVITDEFHGMKGLKSARGRIWGRLIARAARSLGLTGSPYGGKSSTAYWLLQRMANPFVRAEFAWNEEKEFVKRLGIIDTITSQVVEEDAQVLSGKAGATYVRVEERNGITAELAAIMQSQFIFVLLRQMGFLLPNYREGVVFFDLPAGLAGEYARLVQRGKAIITAPGGKDALSSYLQSTLTYPMAPWKPVTVQSKRTGEAYRPPALPDETILPHHRWLAQHAAAQARAGRGMLVFAEHTNKLDVLADLQAKIQRLALTEHGTPVNVAILRSTTVKPGARGAWFAAREQDGTNVVLCHPGLVETGMNLIAWPEIVFAEPTYSLYRAMQARKRALRPTQTRDCAVTWLGYNDTMIAQALDIIGSKATAATLLNGDDLSSGLLQIDPGMSLLQELARRVMNDDIVTSRESIVARLAAAGDVLKRAMEIGARDLVGVNADQVASPDPLRRAGSPPEPTVPPAPDAATTAPGERDGQVMTWTEVLIRSKRGRRSPSAGDEPMIQLAFF